MSILRMGVPKVQPILSGCHVFINIKWVKLEKMSYCSWFGFHEIVVKESATSYLEQKCLNFAPINNG